MIKNLRLFFVAFMAMLGMSAMAEDILWQEDFSSFEANAVPTGGAYNYVCTDGGSATKIYNEKLAGGTAPELLIGKKSGDKIGSFTVEIPLNGKSGSFTLSYMANYDRIVVLPAQKDVVLGEKTQSGNSYSYPVTVGEGLDKVILTFTNETSSNVRFDNVKFFQGTSKKAAGLSWGTASRQVTIGSEDNVFPKLTNENNLPVEYSSDNTEVAKINADGVITLVAAGDANISASFAGNDEYEAQTVSYKLTVKAGGDDPTPVPAVELINVVEALEIIAALGDGNTTTVEYCVKGFIVGTPDFQRKSDQTLYGNVNLTIADEKGGTALLTVYRGKSFENMKFTEETISLLKEGDEVLFQGKLQKYVKNDNVTPELVSGFLVSVNGKTNGIAELKAAKRFEGAIYNLNGQRITTPAKGLYIMNGKKYFVK